MANIIFYFTGTGNSLVVARDIAEKIGDAKIVSIADAIKENNIDLKYERVGFVFPVYYYHMPVIVERFIKKLEFSKSQYIFGVVTYGGMSGYALTQLSQCIVKQSGVLGARFAVLVPGNYIVEYGAFPTIIQTLLFRREKKKTSVISKAVNEKKTTHIPKGNFVSGVLAGYGEKAIASFGKNAQNFNVNGKCTGCASCEMICPVGNIKIENSQPIWGDKCEQCMACIQWCPAQAIEYGDKTAKRKRYQHPEIRISDLVLNSTRNDIKSESKK